LTLKSGGKARRCGVVGVACRLGDNVVVVTEEFVAQINSYKLIERETINNMQHCPDDDDYDNDGDGDDNDDHLTYEERLRVDSYKMLMPIIHLPYKPNKYQYRLCNKSLYRHDDTVSHQRRRQQGIVRRVSDDSVDVSGVVSDMDEDESKADTKEDEDEDCKTHERRTKENNKEEDDKQHEVGYQCQMSIKIKAKTCDGEVLILKDKSTTTTSTENKC